jgi:4-amino-4-deoxy-L-arabinose transferase-like glycosyltransferase
LDEDAGDEETGEREEDVDAREESVAEAAGEDVEGGGVALVDNDEVTTEDHEDGESANAIKSGVVAQLVWGCGDGGPGGRLHSSDDKGVERSEFEVLAGVIQGGVALDSNAQAGDGRRKGRGLMVLLLGVSAAFYAAGFMHLRADFPNGSPWMDWSKMTDEGWYGGAAIHHIVEGSWYLPGSFNPGVAMPVWPAMLGVWFSMTGVSMLAARTLTMVLYGLSLVLLYRVMWRARPGRLAAVVVLLTVINPFCYAFNRMALLEPVTVFWMMLALWLAGQTKVEDWMKQIVLGVVVCLLLLTKVTGIALVPAVFYLLWATWGWPGLRGPGRRAAAGLGVVTGTAAMLWLGYMRLVVRPHYLADYRLLFSVNAYRVHLSIVPRVAWTVLRDGGWFNPALFWMAVVVAVLSLVWFRKLWKMPLFGAAVIAVVGHLAYIAYHTNFQPRYYEVIAMPLVLVLVIGLSEAATVAEGGGRRYLGVGWRWGAMAMGIVVAAVGIGMAVQTLGYVLHPDYTFWAAAQGIGAIVDADGGDRGAEPVLLSDSGDDITLWTGVPAICERYSTEGLGALLARYRPGWYAAWPGWEDEGIEQVGKRYKLNEVARYRVFDDPTRQTLVLYKLTPR